jgi:hypothetical protein
MWVDLVANVFISLVIVVVLHSLYNYLKATYTTKVHRDVGRLHSDKYRAILEELKAVRPSDQGPAARPDDDFLPNQEAEALQHSMMEFVQNIL